MYQCIFTYLHIYIYSKGRVEIFLAFVRNIWISWWSGPCSWCTWRAPCPCPPCCWCWWPWYPGVGLLRSDTLGYWVRQPGSQWVLTNSRFGGLEGGKPSTVSLECDNLCNNLFHTVKAINSVHYPIYLSQIMLRHQEVPIHQITQLGIISCVYKYILSLLIISNEFHDRHLVLVEDVNVLLDICQNKFSKNRRNKNNQ